MDQTIKDHQAAEAAGFHVKPAYGEPDNDSGLLPVDYRVLIRLDPVEERTKGGVIVPDERHDRNQMAQTYATLIAVGGNAFREWSGRIPQPGDRVLITKYAGQTPKAGDITDLYRLANDEDIVAIVK